jgi:hypothetical protein
VHANLVKEGAHVPMSDLFGARGTKLLDELVLGDVYAQRITSLREVPVVRGRKTHAFERDIHEGCGTPATRPYTQIHGVGLVRRTRVLR